MFNYNSIDFNKNNIIKFNKDIFQNKKVEKFSKDSKIIQNTFEKIRLQNKVQFEQIILPKKTIFQLCSLLEDHEGEVKISNIK